MKTAGDIINAQDKVIISVSPEATLKEALEIMTAHNYGAILVIKDGELLGIWTERDLMKDVLSDGFNINTAQIKDYMTSELHYAEHNDRVYQLVDKFLGLRIRHLPVRQEGKFIGMVSSGDVMRRNLEEKRAELNRLNEIVNWEYYENWHWEPGKKKK
ncbi:MAG: hypothetical protein C0622_05540 [Desulfuromonas sp.]|nr:MAG: hypothetical protein C0622_05540 [Desulfuromonas sp.]